MRRNLKTVVAIPALVVGGLLATPALYAQAPGGPHEEGGMMGGMMQEGGPMMGGGMMEQMNRMMATCTEMMQAHMQEHGAPQPNEQPQAPEGGPAPEPGGQPRSPGNKG